MSLSLLQSYESDSSDADETSRDVETEKHHESSSKSAAVQDEPVGEASKQLRPTNVQEDEAELECSQPKDHALASVPPDLLRELKAAGHDTANINIVDINPIPVANQPHPSSHVPQYALRNNAMRLARHITKESVSSVARRKHQITALAAEAVALQVAQDSIPGAARPRSRMNRKFK